MKSKLLLSVSLNGGHVKTLKKISEELQSDTLSKIAEMINEWKILPQSLDSSSSSINVENVNKACIDCNISIDDLSDIFEFSNYITRMVFSNDDNIENIIDDFVTLGFTKETEKEKVNNFFHAILQKGIEMAKQRRRLLFEKGEIASLESMSYDVDLRLITKKSFDPTSAQIENYNPIGIELLPVAIIGLLINDGARKSPTVFQVNFAELEGLIVRLLACQKEMRFLETFAHEHSISEQSN